MSIPLKSLAAVLGLGFFLFFGVFAVKAETLKIQTLTPGQVYQSFGVCYGRDSAQSFTATSTIWISKIEFYGTRTSGTSTIDIALCNQKYSDCFRTSTLLNTDATSTPAWIEVDFDNVQVPSGTYWVYFSTDYTYLNTCPTTKWSLRSTNMTGVNTDYYTGGTATSTIGGAAAPEADDDFAIRIYTLTDEESSVTIDEYPEDEDLIVEVASEEDLDISDKDCIVGEDCIWKFGYNYAYDDGYAYLVPDQELLRQRADAVSSTSLGVKLIRYDTFDVPDPGYSATVDYCVYLETASTTLFLSCGHKVTWYDALEADAMALEDCVADACADLASSSPWWDPDIEGAIGCAFRKFTCWAMTPSTATKLEFKEMQTEVKSNFPFSVYEQIKGIFYEAGDTVSTTSEVTIVPLKWYDSGTGQYEEVGALLTNKTAEEGMGDVYDTYYDWFERIIWIIFFVYCLNRIILLINPQATSLFDIMPKKKKYDTSNRGDDRPLAD